MPLFPLLWTPTAIDRADSVMTLCSNLISRLFFDLESILIAKEGALVNDIRDIVALTLAKQLPLLLRPQQELQYEASLVKIIILGVTRHARAGVRVKVKVRLRVIKMFLKCRDFRDVHQGIVRI